MKIDGVKFAKILTIDSSIATLCNKKKLTTNAEKRA